MRIFRSLLSIGAVCLLSLLGAGCGNSNNPPTLNVHPLQWLDDNELLVGRENAILIYDSSTRRLTRKTYEADKDQGDLDFAGSCISHDRWVLRQIKNINDGKGGRSYQQHWLDVGGIGTDKQVVQETDPPNQADHIECTIGYPSLFGGAAASYDAQTGLYFRYTTTKDFNKRILNSPWPLKGRWVDSNFETKATTDLPAGPWVGEYGTFKKLSCFGCGCECFSNIEFYSAGGRIFALVWGTGIIDGKSGIYELLAPSSSAASWKLLAREAGDALSSRVAISPNGCKLAYHSTRLKILNVCQNKG